ncbi:MAG: NUDIX hydrolase [bacterium]|nr:NUDIX hydrolase [bacterium]
MAKIKRPKPKTKIPKQAKKVFSGVLFDIYQWKQKMFDGSTSTFEAIKRKSDSVGVIPVTKDKKIILTKQIHPAREPFRCTVGGRTDPGETPIETAKREMLEESGCVAKSFVLLYKNQPSSKIDFAVYVFAALGAEKVTKPNPEPGEKIKVIKTDFEGFLKIATRADFRARETSEIAFRALSNPKYKAWLKKKLGL